MTIEDLDKLLIDANLEVIKDALEDLPRKSSLEVAQDWYNNLDGVKFSDWGEELFSYSATIKEIKIPSKMITPLY